MLSNRQIQCAAVLLAAGVKPNTSPEYSALLQTMIEDKNIGTMRPGAWGWKDIHALEVGTSFPEYSQLKKIANQRAKKEMVGVRNSITQHIKDTMYKAREVAAEKNPILKRRAARQLSNELEGVLKKAYFDTYLLGIRGSGLITVSDLDAEDRRWIDTAWKNEKKYLDKFVQDVVNRRDRMAIDKRARMYGNTLDAIYDAARVSGVDPWVLIYWIQDKKAENCIDCEDIARYSPFTKRTLPTTPGAGETRCLSNCKCFLRIVKSTPEKVRQRERELPSRGELLLRLKSIHLHRLAKRKGI